MIHEPERAQRSVLVVDDDDVFRTRLGKAFHDRGFDVRMAHSAAEAIRLAQQDSPEFAVVDLRMPGASGLDVVRELHAIDPASVIVMLTGYGSIATAVEAVRAGARALPEQAGRHRSDPIGIRRQDRNAQRGHAGSAELGARRMGAHSARAQRLRWQYLAGRAALGPASSLAAA